MEKLSDSPSRIAIDVGLIVQDLEQSLGFYQNLLELTVKAKIETSLIGKGLMVQLEHGSSLVKLVQLEQTPKSLNLKGLDATFGYRYLTLLVIDIEAKLERLSAAGVEVYLPLTRLANGTLIAMVYDPDGNVVELVQEPA